MAKEDNLDVDENDLETFEDFTEFYGLNNDENEDEPKELFF
jgi:hypothetical protein